MLNTILLAILVIELGVLIWSHLRPITPTMPFPLDEQQARLQQGNVPMVELLHKGPTGTWLHHSWRPAGHPDVKEALDTPGLAIRTDNIIQKGRQR